jgi:hypothetical protein
MQVRFFLDLFSPSLFAESANENHKTITDDPLFRLLDQQLQGVHASLLVCKWPVTLMSCFFVTLLCWDMAGDKGGWAQALWVPIVGVVVSLVIWIGDRVLMTGAAHESWSRDVSSLFLSCSSLCPNHPHHSPSSSPSSSTLRPGTELVRLHQSAVVAVAQGPSGAILDEEAMVEK